MSSIQIITRESFIGLISIGLWVVFCYMCDLSLGFLLGILALGAWVWAFRNPERVPLDRGDDVILAPIDGRVSNIEQDKKHVRVSVDVSFFDVGLVRAPRAVESISLEKRAGLVAYFSPLAKDLNESLHAQITGTTNYKLSLYPKIFKQSRFYAPIDFGLGERMGFMKVGTLILELPASVELRVHIGDRIKGGSSVLGYVK